jgi:hypothetical protein
LTVTVVPLTVTVATPVALDDPVNTDLPPVIVEVLFAEPGSVKLRFVGDSVITAPTVTAIVAVSLSASVIVIVHEPTATGVTVTVVPTTATVAMAGALDDPVKVARPPEMAEVLAADLGSVNAKEVGDRLMAAPTVTAMVALSESASVTVIVALPAVTGVTVTVVPATVTVATAGVPLTAV